MGSHHATESQTDETDSAEPTHSALCPDAVINLVFALARLAARQTWGVELNSTPAKTDYHGPKN
jgi:hypothetical protein